MDKYLSLYRSTCIACVYDVDSYLASWVPSPFVGGSEKSVLHRVRECLEVVTVEQPSIVLAPFPAGARLPGLLLTFGLLPMLHTLLLL